MSVFMPTDPNDWEKTQAQKKRGMMPKGKPPQIGRSKKGGLSLVVCFLGLPHLRLLLA